MHKVKSIFCTAGVCVIIAFVCLFGYLMLQNMCAEIFIRLGWETATQNDLFQNGFWVTFIICAILPPLYEELIFRFAICKGLQLVKMPQWLIIMVSAVIFMVYHRSWSQTVYQLLMGIWFAWIFLRTNNLCWTILIHFINNAFVITYTYIAGIGSEAFNLNAGSIILSLSLAVVTTAAVIFLIKKGIPNAKR